MDDLRRRTIRAFLSLPKRGAEIGGFLFGHVRQEDPVTFEIDTCEEIQCEYRFGPSYRLSESDYRRLSERMAQLRHDGCRPVIGLYRSYTGRDTALDQTDQELVRHLFPNQRIVSLLLQPISPERCIARFQFANDGEPAAEGPYEPFLFEPSQLKVETVDEPEPLEAAAAATAPAGAVAVEAVEPARPMLVPLPAPAVRHLRLVDDEEPRAVRKSSPWPLVLWCVLAVMAGAVGYQLWVLERQPRWAPLGLQATASAQDVVLSWNPAAPAIQQAAQGVMNVTDGSVQNQIPLTATQLHAGKLHYAASHENLLFRLLVYDEGKHAAGDSLYFARVLPAEAAPVHAAAAAPTPVPPQGATAPPVAAAQVADTPADDTARGGTPAVARRQVQPAIPPGIRARVRSRIVVPVQVHIDASGRVTGAVSKSAGSGLDRYLADQAVKAARKWSFTPAHSRSGRAVASTKSVEFVFEPAR
jgi:TonB family protein